MSHLHHNSIATVIDIYGLELEDYQVDSIIDTWLQTYDDSWIVKAIVESLYRGRYKIKSVDNILKDWQRLGKPRYNFTPEYEREILQNLPALIDRFPTSTPPTADSDLDLETAPNLVTPPSGSISHHLNPEESAPFHYHDLSIPPARSTNSALGVIVTVEDRQVADEDSIETSQADKQASFIYVPTSVAILQGQVYISNEPQNNVSLEQTTTSPVKLQLFHTLKAIVDPNNNHHQAEVDSSPASDCHATNSHYTHFHLPTEEQYF